MTCVSTLDAVEPEPAGGVGRGVDLRRARVERDGDARQHGAGRVVDDAFEQLARRLSGAQDGHGQDEQGHDRGHADDGGTRRQTTIESGVQHRDDPPFQRGHTSHPHHGHCRRPAGSDDAGNLHEMIGVGGGADAGLEHGVIAGQLAVVAQRAAGEPGQRVPPEQRAQRLGDGLEKPVVAHDVRHLVRQHRPHTLVAPAQPARGDHHARPPPPPCRKQQGLRRDEQANGPAERRVTADGIERLAPAHILHHHRLRDQAAEAHDGDEQPAERHGGPRAPEGESQGRPAHAGGDRRIGLRDAGRHTVTAVCVATVAAAPRSGATIGAWRAPTRPVGTATPGVTAPISPTTGAATMAAASTACRSAGERRRRPARRASPISRTIDARRAASASGFIGPPPGRGGPALRSARARRPTRGCRRRRAAPRRPGRSIPRRTCRPGASAPAPRRPPRHRRRIDEAHAVDLVADVALAFEHAELRPHRRVAGRAGSAAMISPAVARPRR